MKITHCSTSRRFFLGAALFAGAGFVTQAAAQAQERSYLIELKSKTLTELRSPDGGQAHATAMNDAGQVVGFSYTPAGDKNAFITGSDGAGVRKIDSFGTNARDRSSEHGFRFLPRMSAVLPLYVGQRTDETR